MRPLRLSSISSCRRAGGWLPSVVRDRAFDRDRDRRRPVARQRVRREAAVEGDPQVALLGELAVRDRRRRAARADESDRYREVGGAFLPQSSFHARVTARVEAMVEAHGWSRALRGRRVRRLPDRAPARPRRDGDPLPGDRAGARAAGGAEADRARRRPPTRSSPGASPRSRGSPPRSSTRTWSRSTPPASRTASPTSRCATSPAPTWAGGSPARDGCDARARGRPDRPGRQRPRRDPRRRPGPPRRQARQRPAQRRAGRRARLHHRLRRRPQRRHPVGPDPDRPLRRHPRLRRSRADLRRRGRRPGRRLRARLPALQAAHRRGAVPARGRGGAPLRPPQRPAPGALALRAGGADGARRRRHPGDVEAARATATPRPATSAAPRWRRSAATAVAMPERTVATGAAATPDRRRRWPTEPTAVRGGSPSRATASSCAAAWAPSSWWRIAGCVAAIAPGSAPVAGAGPRPPRDRTTEGKKKPHRPSPRSEAEKPLTRRAAGRARRRDLRRQPEPATGRRAKRSRAGRAKRTCPTRSGSSPSPAVPSPRFQALDAARAATASLRRIRAGPGTGESVRRRSSAGGPARRRPPPTWRPAKGATASRAERYELAREVGFEVCSLHVVTHGIETSCSLRKSMLK